MRNQFYSEYRKRRRDVQDADGIYMKTMVMQPEQIARTEYGELRRALAKLPKQMSEILILLGVHGVSYPEAARICGCATGTIKSRLHRARACLAAMLSIESEADFASDPNLQSILVSVESARAMQHNELSH
jgi:RNA polymerase sigma-70 factor (ECF subfamily)